MRITTKEQALSYIAERKTEIRGIQDIFDDPLFDDEYVGLAIVKNNPKNLEFVRRQTPEICLAAVQQDARAVQYIYLSE